MERRDPFDLAVIPKRTCVSQVGGSEGVVDRAERAGIVRFKTTPTGRQYATPRDFANLIRYADRLVDEHL